AAERSRGARPRRLGARLRDPLAGAERRPPAATPRAGDVARAAAHRRGARQRPASHVLAGALPASEAKTLLSAGATLVDLRYETSEALRGGAWELRDNLSFYDALARALDLSLLTADAKLARTPKLPCAVELVASA
nr:hypothetical protein [Thermoleophilaceae bacterium]